MKKLALLGTDIGYARSPQLHHAAALALDAEVEFDVVDLPADALVSWLTDAGAEYHGAAITKPFKESIMPHLHQLSPVAQRLGAVNTITRTDAGWSGTNTDGYGAMVALGGADEIAGKRVLVLGAGGAARAVCLMLNDINAARTTIWNRTADRVTQLIADLKLDQAVVATDLAELDDGDFDIIINTTTVGLNEDVSLLAAEFFTPRHTVLDAVYSPLETTMLRFATDAGARIITGDSMLVHQAIAQCQLWHGAVPDAHVLEQAFFEGL